MTPKEQKEEKAQGLNKTQPFSAKFTNRLTNKGHFNHQNQVSRKQNKSVLGISLQKKSWIYKQRVFLIQPG